MKYLKKFESFENIEKEFVYVLLDKNEEQVTINASDVEEAGEIARRDYRGYDPMLISIDGKKVSGFSGIEPRAAKYESLNEARVVGFENPNEGNFVVIAGGPGAGKAQPLYSKILTPNGWTTMGEINIGDEVCSPDGKISKVVQVFPQNEKKPIYRFTFKDGRTVDAADNHLWKVFGIREGKNRERVWKVLTTDKIKYYFDNVSSVSNRLAVPLLGEVNYNPRSEDFIIDHYLMGLLLGDGHFRKDKLILTSNDDEIFETVKENLIDGYKLGNRNNLSHTIVMEKLSKVKTRSNEKYSSNVYLDESHKLGLLETRSDNKFIPEKYLFSSIEDRYKLLRGLLDSDGTISKNGNITYSTVSERLSKDVQKLIWSLGGVCTIKEKQTYYTIGEVKKKGKLAYTLKIRHSYPGKLFSLKRKLDRVPKNYQYSDSLKNNIVNIEYIGDMDAKCIMIDHPEHLYITDDYVVTHNSFVTGNLLGLRDFKLVNVDTFREAMARKLGLDLGDPEDNMKILQMTHTTSDPRNRTVRHLKQFLSIPKDRKPNIVFDAGGGQTEVMKTVHELAKNIGYETTLVYVKTDLDTALARNRQRERTLKDEMVIDYHNLVKQSIDILKDVFDNVWEVDNSEIWDHTDRPTDRIEKTK